MQRSTPSVVPPVGRGEAIDATNAADGSIIRESETGCEYQGSDVEPKIVQLFEDSRTFDFTPYHGKMDLVHIDGAHDYEASGAIPKRRCG
jgi:hypothetical protein